MFRFFLLPLFLFLGLGSAPGFAAGAQNTPLKLIVSIPAQKYMLERIAGNLVEVTALVSPGDDPHSYEPSPSQMRAVAAAGRWFTIGVPFEDVWLPRIAGAAPEFKETSMIKGLRRLTWDDSAQTPPENGKHEDEAGHELEPGHVHEAEHEHADGHVHEAGHEHADGHVHEAGHEHAAGHVHEAGHEHAAGHVHEAGHHHQHGAYDPHVWLSPMLVREMTDIAAKELRRLLPGKAAEIRRNTAAFLEELEKLDAELAAAFAEFPRERRVFLTFHPSWRYFAHNYELTELSLESEGKEPGPRHLTAVTDKAREMGIRTVFVEPQFPKGSAKAVAEALNAEVVEINPLAENLPELYKDVAAKLITSFRKQAH